MRDEDGDGSSIERAEMMLTRRETSMETTAAMKKILRSRTSCMSDCTDCSTIQKLTASRSVKGMKQRRKTRVRRRIVAICLSYVRS